MMSALVEPPSFTLFFNSNNWVASIRFSSNIGITSFAKLFLNFVADTLEALRHGFFHVEQHCPIATAPTFQHHNHILLL